MLTTKPDATERHREAQRGTESGSDESSTIAAPTEKTNDDDDERQREAEQDRQVGRETDKETIIERVQIQVLRTDAAATDGNAEVENAQSNNGNPVDASESIERGWVSKASVDGTVLLVELEVDDEEEDGSDEDHGEDDDAHAVHEPSGDASELAE